MALMGPLDGVKILELGSIGPGPFAAMVLSGMGASVLRLHRPGEAATVDIRGAGVDRRGRPALAVDLKEPEGVALALRLSESADALIEGFRPGVMERLGLGPDEVLERNPRLVYGRMTGYGQDGPLATVPGHDINYLAISGALGSMARAGERPLFPLNLLGDYGGGGMLLAFGLVCGILEAQRSGHGQVVDAAMVDGVAQLATIFFSFQAAGAWGAPGTNALDSGAHFYEVYETADGGHMAVGAIEPQFYAELLRLLDVPASEAPQWDRSAWPVLKERLAGIFRSRTRAEWTAVFEQADACTTPVLSLREAVEHPHNAARGTFAERDGAVLPVPAPRFSRTVAGFSETPDDRAAILAAWGIRDEQLARADL
jgi:alpha-methylacyl-CoA racemase